MYQRSFKIQKKNGWSCLNAGLFKSRWTEKMEEININSKGSSRTRVGKRLYLGFFLVQILKSAVTRCRRGETQMLVSLAQRMLVSGRGLDSWIKIKQNKKKKKERIATSGFSWGAWLILILLPGVSRCRTPGRVPAPSSDDRIPHDATAEAVLRGHKGHASTRARLKEVQQEASQGQERNHNHANCVWFAASRSELSLSAAQTAPPPPTPPPTHKWF